MTMASMTSLHLMYRILCMGTWNDVITSRRHVVGQCSVNESQGKMQKSEKASPAKVILRPCFCVFRPVKFNTTVSMHGVILLRANGGDLVHAVPGPQFSRMGKDETDKTQNLSHKMATATIVDRMTSLSLQV